MSLEVTGRVRLHVEGGLDPHTVDITVTEEEILRLIEKKAESLGLKPKLFEYMSLDQKQSSFFPSILEVKHRVNTF